MSLRSDIPFPKKIIFSLIIVIAIFSATEGILRWLGLPRDASIRRRREEMWKRKGVESDVTLPWSWSPIPNGLCVFDAKGFFRFNSLGFRGPTVPKVKAPGTLRIVCMGDSCTMGWQVGDDQTFCAKLPALLASKIPQRVETINAGVLGYASSQGLHQLRTKILPLHPDLIIASYNWNDHSQAIDIQGSRPDRELPQHAAVFHQWAFSLSKLRIVQCMAALILRFHENSVEKSDDFENPSQTTALPTLLRVPREDYIANWMEFIKITKQNHITLVLMTQPYKLPNRKEPSILFLIQKQREYNRDLIRIALKTGTPLVDPTPDFHAHRNRGQLFSSIVHPTELGHQLIAQKLADFIADLQNGKSR